VNVIFSELFTIVVDMLAILVHGTLAGELSDKGDENKKVHQSLIRKLKVCIAAFCQSIVVSFVVIHDTFSPLLIVKAVAGVSLQCSIGIFRIAYGTNFAIKVEV